MCSVNEDIENTVVAREMLTPGKKCMKCDESATLVTRMGDAFCRECFQAYAVHKFRAAIGKSKLIRHGEKVLVAFSGGASSLTMLHLINIGLGESTHKKFRFVPGLLFVDERCVVDVCDQDYQVNCDVIVDHMKKSGFPCYSTSIEQSISDITNESYKQILSEEENSSTCDHATGDMLSTFQKTMSSFTSLSAKQEFLRNMRLNLIVSIAKKEGYSKVMVGDCSTRLSVRLLTDIAQGKGAHIPLETHFSDNRYGDIMVIRPVRDFSVKEVAMYNHLNGLKLPFIPGLSTKAAALSSIEQLTESFVTGLQNEFPSTVSNIVRTGEKLGTQAGKEGSSCVLCQAPLDTSVPLASALNAVEFSRTVSSKPVPQCDNTNISCCGEGDGSCRSADKCSINKEDVVSCLCYSCRLVLLDQNKFTDLPQNILDEISKRTRRNKMKSDIEDFLLDDSDER